MSGCDTPCRIAPLVNAERIIEEQPDSALAILTKLNDSILNTPGDKALYALLLTQANVKTYTANASDSLINIAVDYYSGRRDKERYMKSLFYQAQVRYDIGQYDMAIVPASTARDFAIEFGDPYWRAKAAELMADIFAKYYMRQETIDYTKESVEQYGLAGKERNKRFALTDLAIAYYDNALDFCTKDNINDNTEIKQSEHFLDSLYKISLITPVDSLWLSYILQTQFDISVQTRNIERADSLINSLSQIDSEYYHSILDILCNSAELQICKGNFTEARNLLEIAQDQANSIHEKASVLKAYVCLYRNQHDYLNMAKSLDDILELQNIGVHNAFQQSIVTKQKDEAENKIEKEKAYSWRITIIFIVIVSFLIVMTVFVMIYMKIKLKLNKIKAQQVEEELISLKDDVVYFQEIIDTAKQDQKNLLDLIEDKDKQISEIQEKMNEMREDGNNGWQNDISELQEKLDEAIRSKENLVVRADQLESMLVSQIKDNESKKIALEILFKERWEIIGKLCNDYISKNGATEFDKNLPKTLREEIDKLNRPKERKQLIALVNYYMDDIITLLKAEGDFIHSSEEEFLYALFFLGFSNKTISLLTKINFKTVFTKKSRLKEKIISTNPPHKDLFLSKLH